MISTALNGLVLLRAKAAPSDHGGLSREAWPLIDEAYWKDLLQSEVRCLYEEIQAQNRPSFWLPWVSLSLPAARKLCSLALFEGVACDLVGVESEYLGSLGFEVQVPEAEIEELGFDIVKIGEWSILGLLTAAIDEMASADAAELNAMLNANRLCETTGDLPRVLSIYERYARSGSVESIGDPPYELGVEEVRLVAVTIESAQR